MSVNLIATSCCCICVFEEVFTIDQTLPVESPYDFHFQVIDLTESQPLYRFSCQEWNLQEWRQASSQAAPLSILLNRALDLKLNVPAWTSRLAIGND